MTADDLKVHLNITGSEDDAVLADKLAAASDWIAKFISADDINKPAVQEAVLQVAATYYEQREAVFAGSLDIVPFGVWDLIEPYRLRDF